MIKIYSKTRRTFILCVCVLRLGWWPAKLCIYTHTMRVYENTKKREWRRIKWGATHISCLLLLFITCIVKRPVPTREKYHAVKWIGSSFFLSLSVLSDTVYFSLLCCCCYVIRYVGHRHAWIIIEALSKCIWKKNSGEKKQTERIKHSNDSSTDSIIPNARSRPSISALWKISFSIVHKTGLNYSCYFCSLLLLLLVSFIFLVFSYSLFYSTLYRKKNAQDIIFMYMWNCWERRQKWTKTFRYERNA